jgi:hypothetical protein
MPYAAAYVAAATAADAVVAAFFTPACCRIDTLFSRYVAHGVRLLLPPPADAVAMLFFAFAAITPLRQMFSISPAAAFARRMHAAATLIFFGTPSPLLAATPLSPLPAADQQYAAARDYDHAAAFTLHAAIYFGFRPGRR